MKKEVVHINELTVKPCEQYPSVLIDILIGTMADIIILDDAQDECIKDRVQLMKDLSRPIIEAIKKNEDNYGALLKEVQR